MQHPWTQFATNYADKGISNHPSMYPSNPVPMSPPSYNRSPAPFNSASYQQPPLSPQNQFMVYSNQQQQQHHQQQQQHQQYNGFQQAEPVYQEPQQWQQFEEQHQQQLYQEPEYVDSLQAMGRAKNTREDPDIDEDFPSYKDLRKVFVEKQRESQKVNQRPQIRSWQKASQPIVTGKPPSPITARRPPPSPPHRSHPIYRQPSKTSHMTIESPQKPRRIFSQVSHQGVPMEVPQHDYRINQSMAASPRRRSSSFTQVKRHPSSQYQEVPVHHVMNDPSAPWQHIKPNRDAVRYRPPMSVIIPTQTDGSPKVVITSNSPRSPQKATYIPDGENPITFRQTNFVASNPPLNVAMRSSDNQPKRRRSYAEVLITHNSLPRNFTTRRSASHHASQQEIINGNMESPRQRRYNTLGRTQPQNSATYQTWGRGSSMPASEPIRVDMRPPTINQMLYPSSPESECNLSV